MADRSPATLLRPLILRGALLGCLGRTVFAATVRAFDRP
jgi:hypothetical protein